MKKRPKLCNSISQTAQVGGWAYYVFELLFLPSLLLTLAAKLGVGDAVVNFVYYLLNFFFCVSIFRDFLSDSLDAAGKHMAAFVRAVALGFLCHWGVNALMGMLIARFAPDFANVNDQAIAVMTAQHPLLMTIGTVLLVPVAEEGLFRGLIFSQLHPKSRTAAYAVSVLAFGLIHVMGYVGLYPPATLALCILQYIPAGLIFAWAYEHCGSILAPILIHTAVNAVAFFALR